MLAKGLGAALFAAMGGAVLTACSSPDSGIGANDASADAIPLDAGPDRCRGAGCVPVPDAPLSCPTPSDVSGFAPPPLVQARPATDACSPTAVSGYFDACLGKAATQQTCSAFVAQNQACATCLESRSTDKAWGPLVRGTGVVSLNVSGCLALLGAGGCAQAYQDVQECGKAACDERCPVSDDASFAAYQKCRQAAAAGACKPWGDKADAACAPDAGAVGLCTDFADFAAGYAAIAPVFCGAGG